MTTYVFTQGNYQVYKALNNNTEAENFKNTYLDNSWTYSLSVNEIENDLSASHPPVDIFALSDRVDVIETIVNPRYVTVTFDGGGSAITSGLQAEVQIPFSGTVSSWLIYSTATGSCVVDVLKCDDFSAYPTFTSIAGSEKPTLTSQIKNQDLILSTWSQSISSGNILRFNVDSALVVQKVYITIKIQTI
jgi:hypothetical protein